MKRRNIIISFLLAACLIVGVGYAALSDTLKIAGSAEYSPEAVDLSHNVYFTGIKYIVNRDHSEVLDNDAFIVDAVGGSQDARITAQFTNQNLQAFAGDSSYIAGVVLQVAIEGDNNGAITVEFGDFAQTGTFGTQSVFSLDYKVMSDWDSDATEITDPITVEADATEPTYVYVHVKISMGDGLTQDNIAVPKTDFEITLPVSEVE